MRTNWIPEIVKRSYEGPFIKEPEYDKMISKLAKELAKKHGIRFDPAVPITSDDDLADRLYEASVEMFVELGIYNQTTSRRIMFTRDEVDEIIANAPREITLGMGKDAVVMRHRGVESTIPAIVQSGPTGTPCSEKYHPLILQSCAQEALIEGLGAGSVSTYKNVAVSPDTPLEVLAVQRDATVAREIVRRAGRPGMHINDCAAPLTCQGKIAAMDPHMGLRPSDALLVTQMVELRTDFDQLSRVPFMQAYGIHITGLMTPLVGGLGGGAEGTAIVTIASHLMCSIFYHASNIIHGHMNLLKSINSDRMGLWIYSLSGQALARNTPLLTMTTPYTYAGLCTDEVLWEIATVTVAATVAGLHHDGVGATGGSIEDHTSGLEQRFFAEVSHACLGMKRDAANELVLELLSHYEESHKDEPLKGKPFSEIYDLDAVEPTEEWLEHYHRVKDGVAAIGLDVHNGWRKRNNG